VNRWSFFLIDVATQSLLGGSLLGQQKYAAAEPFLLSGYEGVQQHEDDISTASKQKLTAGLFQLGSEFHLPTAPPFLPTTRSHRSQVRGTDLSRPRTVAK
jgi:hypothetical protein